jgi:hypothetical protein
VAFFFRVSSADPSVGRVIKPGRAYTLVFVLCYFDDGREVMATLCLSGMVECRTP